MKAWAGLGYYSRARNLHACAIAVARGTAAGFPPTEAGLRACRASAPIRPRRSAAIAFDRPAVVVDGNVERVMTRLHTVDEPLPGAKPPDPRWSRTC
jgi:A/G-specific adenine glycosylase